AEHRALLGGVLIFGDEHVWTADTAKPEQRAAWIDLLDEMAALDPRLVVPGHRLPGTPADASTIAGTREYLLAFEAELATAAGDLAALRATLAPDVEWTEMAGFPLAGTYRTPEGVTANVMQRLGAGWDGWTAHDDTYVVDGENVVVLARYTATNKATGKPID